MEDIEKRVAALEVWRKRVEPHINCTIPLGPNPDRDKELEENRAKEFEKIVKNIKLKKESNNG